MLYREPKLLKYAVVKIDDIELTVSVLYREPKLLKSYGKAAEAQIAAGFSALP